MKKFIFISLISLFLAMPVWAGYTLKTLPAPTDTIPTDPLNPGFGPYQTGSGGEFTVQAEDGLEQYLAYYDSKAKDQVDETKWADTFQTFCIEATGGEYITTNHTYHAELNYKAVAGGTGPTGDGDPISVGTAWLYSQFARGTLSDFGYNYGSGRAGSADLLQKAIWGLEEEGAYPVSNIFFDAAVTKFGTIVLAMAHNLNSSGVYQYPVMALNLTNSSKLYQDQLIMTPIPATILLGLLGVGVGGWKLRKQVKA